jgi:excisionase family DNA binding protein
LVEPSQGAVPATKDTLGEISMKKQRHPYTLLSGEEVFLGWLEKPEIEFLEGLKAGAGEGESYFALLEDVRGKEAYPLRPYDGVVTEEAEQSIFFRVANDIVQRAGIAQKRIIRPRDTLDIKNIITAGQACEILDITRSGINFLLTRGKIKGWKLGKLWLVDRASAEQYRRSGLTTRR